MSYRAMSNREGNQQRIMEMHEVNMSFGVIAAYMTDWKVPLSPKDVEGIVNSYESLGNHAVKKSDVRRAIETHKRFIEPLNEISLIVEEGQDSEAMAITREREDGKINARVS